MSMLPLHGVRSIYLVAFVHVTSMASGSHRLDDFISSASISQVEQHLKIAAHYPTSRHFLTSQDTS